MRKAGSTLLPLALLFYGLFGLSNSALADNAVSVDPTSGASAYQASNLVTITKTMDGSTFFRVVDPSNNMCVFSVAFDAGTSGFTLGKDSDLSPTYFDDDSRTTCTGSKPSDYTVYWSQDGTWKYQIVSSATDGGNGAPTADVLAEADFVQGGGGGGGGESTTTATSTVSVDITPISWGIGYAILLANMWFVIWFFMPHRKYD